MKKRLALILAVAALAACGGGSDAPPQKDLFSLWAREGAEGTIDLRGLNFSQQADLLTIDQDGSQCNCKILFVGTQQNGTAAINQCTYVQGSSARDPGCSARGGTSQYTNVDGLLTVSSPNGTVTFR